MAFNKFQFKSLIQRILKNNLPPYLCTSEAVELLLGTAAQESNFGTNLKQLNKGPGLGIFQIEPYTFIDLIKRYGGAFPIIKEFNFEQLEWDLKASIIMARIKYFSCPGPIPKTLEEQAKYWNKYYNCNPNYGTEEEYINNYNKYVI